MHRMLSLAAGLLAMSSAAHALTITGQVTLGGSPLAGVTLTAPKATCTGSDAGGNYSCTVSASWNGALAPYLTGYAFAPASITYNGVTTNQINQNFTGSLALGLRAELGVYRPGNSTFFLDYNLDRVSDGIALFGAPGDIGLTGDLDGNGVSDLILYRNGIWFIDYNLTGNVSAQTGFGGAAGDIPLVGEWHTQKMPLHRMPAR